MSDEGENYDPLAKSGEGSQILRPEGEANQGDTSTSSGGEQVRSATGSGGDTRGETHTTPGGEQDGPAKGSGGDVREASSEYSTYSESTEPESGPRPASPKELHERHEPATSSKRGSANSTASPAREHEPATLSKRVSSPQVASPKGSFEPVSPSKRVSAISDTPPRIPSPDLPPKLTMGRDEDEIQVIPAKHEPPADPTSPSKSNEEPAIERIPPRPEDEIKVCPPRGTAQRQIEVSEKEIREHPSKETIQPQDSKARPPVED